MIVNIDTKKLIEILSACKTDSVLNAILIAQPEMNIEELSVCADCYAKITAAQPHVIS